MIFLLQNTFLSDYMLPVSFILDRSFCQVTTANRANIMGRPVCTGRKLITRELRHAIK